MMFKHMASTWMKQVLDCTVIRSMRQGLIMLMPLLMIGAVARILINLPVARYQQAFNTLWGGSVYHLLSDIYESVFGYMAIYVAVAVSVSHTRITRERGLSLYSSGAIFAAVASFIILSGARVEIFDAEAEAYVETYNMEALGVQGVFIALIASAFSSVLYNRLSINRKVRLRLFSDGADTCYLKAMQAIVPLLACICAASAINVMLSLAFDIYSLQELFVYLCDHSFPDSDNNFGNGLLFVGLSSLFSFIGMSGEKVLVNVMQTVFAADPSLTGVSIDKCFIDAFVFMGGCGTSICLLLALLLFSRQKNTRSLAKLVGIPVLFNINEPLIGGLPVVMNPILSVPFLLTPMVLTATSFVAMRLGLVPTVIESTIWTTPVIWSGYLATGSIAGSVLQIVNIAIGVLIYRPFIRLYERARNRDIRLLLQRLVALCQRADIENQPLPLLNRDDSLGSLCRLLTTDLKQAIACRQIPLFYQPHHNASGRCVGAEALLRWAHPTLGRIYPPLVIRLAKEAGLLKELEYAVFSCAAKDIRTLSAVFGEAFHVSVNMTPSTLLESDVVAYLSDLIKREHILPGQLMIEVTEQMMINWNADSEMALEQMKQLGVVIAIDDFSMGHTSLQYMQCKSFEAIKLDGTLVRGICDDITDRKIVSSIIGLANSLHYQVIAEYVETQEQFELLRSLGCHQFQGYLFSPAIPMEKLIGYR